MNPPTDRLDYPATGRNRDPILEVLRRVLPEEGLVLEIASGSGQHALHFADALPRVTWQPSDMEEHHRRSIAAWAEESRHGNLRPVLELDVRTRPWPVARVDALFNANMIHIAGWEVCLALLAGAAEVLAPGGPLVLYGPFNVGGEFTSDSNQAFDRSLRDRDPSWGIRDLEAVREAATGHGLAFEEEVAMPANNKILVFRRG